MTPENPTGGEPEEKDLFVAMSQGDHAEVYKQVKSAEKDFVVRLDEKKQMVENDREIQTLASEIDRLCSELIALGKKTEGDLVDDNGPFSQLERQIKEAVKAYERKIIEKFGEYQTPLSSRIYPKYIADNFLSKARFPYLTVGTSHETDRLTNRIYDFMTVELDDIAIVDAIDAE